ncbi:unnamed protein product, partial [Anisakis simplex]|uniref:Cadherin domain-containing protein n=1 Tax=Anisakis simplex TaxID=6269 RepID=A0A0M3J427_ANISI
VTHASLNDAPIPTNDTYEFFVNEGFVGAIGEVQFTDADNDEITLSIEPKSYRSFFAIDPKSGKLSVKKALNYSMEYERYTFLVLATDTGVPPLTAFANVIVTLIDTNDHAPVFNQNDYSVILPSDAVIPYPVPLRIIVRDGDHGENAKIRYSLKGKDANCFAIDSERGSLTFNCDLANSAPKTNYTFKGTAVFIDLFGRTAVVSMPNVDMIVITYLQVVATDRNGEGKSTEAEVVVLIAYPTVASPSSTEDLSHVDKASTVSSLESPVTSEIQPSVDNRVTEEENLDSTPSSVLKPTQSLTTSNDIDSRTVKQSSSGIVPLPTPSSSKQSSNHAPTFPYPLYKSLMPEGRYGSGTVLSMKPAGIRAEDVDEVRHDSSFSRIEEHIHHAFNSPNYF